MRAISCLGALLSFCVFVLSCGCQPSLTPEVALTRELADRREAKFSSAENCRTAMAALDREDLGEAERLLGKAVSEDPTNARAWTAMGMVRYRQHRLYEAAQAFDQACRLAPSRFEPRYDLAVVLEAAGSLSQAAEGYEKALKLAPGQTEVMENLARCYVRMNVNLDKAQALAAQALVHEYRPEWIRWLEQHSTQLHAQPLERTETSDDRQPSTRPCQRAITWKAPVLPITSAPAPAESGDQDRSAVPAGEFEPRPTRGIQATID